MRRDYFGELQSNWWHSLGQDLPAAEDDGAIGERNFIREMQRHLDSEYVVARRLQQNYGEDVDIIIIGPKGIWVFEVKYWSGIVTWRNDKWRHEKPQSGNNQGMELRPISQPPDEQQQRAVEEVKKTLRRNAPELMRNFPKAIPAGGGLAFTHDRAELRIHREIPVEWGRTQDWVNRLTNAPKFNNWRKVDTVIALEALLERHQVINDNIAPRSMEVVAMRLVRRAEQELRGLAG